MDVFAFAAAKSPNVVVDVNLIEPELHLHGDVLV
jgi:hypothetical protein